MTEIGWHHASYAGDVKVAALPAIHQSRRGLFDANTWLWAAFLFGYHGFKVYFGGDSAMGPVFAQTSHKYGPIDLTLSGIGAYAPQELLRSVHASPEKAVEMGKAIKSKSYGECIGGRLSSHRKIRLSQRTDLTQRRSTKRTQFCNPWWRKPLHSIQWRRRTDS